MNLTRMMARASRQLAWAAVSASALLAPSAALAGSNVPDWVRDAAKLEVPHYPANTKAVILFEDTVYTVGADGRATEHVRRAVKILRPQGRDEAIPVVYYDKDSKITLMHVWGIGADGKEFAAKDSDMVDIGLEGGGEMYSDDRVRVMRSPPGSDPGGIVAYEYERKDRPYLAETTWFLQGTLPRVKQSFTLVLPDGYTKTTTWAHHAADAGVDTERHQWRWEANDVRGVDLEEVPMSPATLAVAGRMTVHYSGPGLAQPQEGTWKGIGEWYAGLEGDRLQPSPEIAAKAAELTRGKTDFYDKTEAIGEFVQQQIRYFAVEIGVGGYQPHPAPEIFRARYGDCKDKATLLSAMLSSVGIHSALVIVDTERGVIDVDAPSILGNHAIGAIEIPSGYESPKLRSVVTAKSGKRYLIFDPTWDKTPFGQLEHNLQGSYGMLMEGPASQVIQLPVLSPDLNKVERSARFELAANGELKGDVLDKRFGDLAVARRDVFTREDLKDQQKFMDRTLRRDFNTVSVTDVKVENATALNKDLTTTYTVDAAHFATSMGPLLMVRPRVLGSFELDVDRKPRNVPIDLGETMKGTDVFDIGLPAGYKVDELPDPVKVDLGFASYESKTELRGQSLHYTRTFTVREVTLPPDRYNDVRKLAGIIAADEENKAVLKRSE